MKKIFLSNGQLTQVSDIDDAIKVRQEAEIKYYGEIIS